MGIKNLLGFLKSISQKINLNSIRGSVVAVDAYCWLHKSVITCSNKLVMGDDTDVYVKYCIRYLNLLKHYDIKVILVYDGKNLPAKQSVDSKRNEMRNINKKKALQLVAENKHSEAKDYFDRCVNITHDIAVKLIKAADKLGFKSIVAPYEADSQLAYLSINGFVDYVITEDSDLLAFGASKVIFKLDFEGNGVLIDKMDLNKVLKMSPEKYSFDKFRFICIIAGCDYYNGIQRIGLATATLMMQKTQLTQLSEFLKRINMYSKSRIELSEEDIQLAERANLTFQHQIVFDPISKQQIPIRPFPVGAQEHEFMFAGTARHAEDENDKTMIQLAIGARYPDNAEIVPRFYDSEFKINESKHLFHYDKINHSHKNDNHSSSNKPDLVRRHTVASALSRAPFASPLPSTTNNSSKSINYKGSFPWIKKSTTNDDIGGAVIRKINTQSDQQIDEELSDLLSDYTTGLDNGKRESSESTQKPENNNHPHKQIQHNDTDESNKAECFNNDVIESDKLVTAKAIVMSERKTVIGKELVDNNNNNNYGYNKENVMDSEVPLKRTKHDDSRDVISAKNTHKPHSRSMSKKSMIQSTLPHLFKKKASDN